MSDMGHSAEKDAPPFVVDLGYYAERVIDGGWPERHMKLLFYPDGLVRFQHLCDRGKRGVIVCAPHLSPGHVITPAFEQPYPSVPHGSYVPLRLTVTPSILCTDCGTHGFITDGRWSE